MDRTGFLSLVVTPLFGRIYKITVYIAALQRLFAVMYGGRQEMRRALKATSLFSRPHNAGGEKSTPACV